MVRGFSFLGILAWLSSSLAARPESFSTQSPDVQILAANQQRLPDGTIRAEGDAVLTSEDLTIEANAIEFHPGSDAEAGPVARATGNVILRRRGDVLRCSDLRLDLNTGRGEFQLR